MNMADVGTAAIPYWRFIRRHDVQHEEEHYRGRRQYGFFFVDVSPRLQREGGQAEPDRRHC